MKNIRIWITTGYILISLVVCMIGYRWHIEWDELEKLEIKNTELNYFREELHNVYIHLIDFSLSGETILEWDATDLE